MSTTSTSSSDVLTFLTCAKKLVLSGAYTFVPRRKNLLSLANCGLTIADVKNEIIGLTVADYYKGPKRDFDPSQPGDIWEFKKNVDGNPFYVKLKIQNINGQNVLKCLSFHEDDFS